MKAFYEQRSHFLPFKEDEEDIFQHQTSQPNDAEQPSVSLSQHTDHHDDGLLQNDRVLSSSQEPKTYSFVSSRTRIAIYEDGLSAPRVLDINPDETQRYIGAVASETHRLSHEIGGVIPYTVILELVENFIHAQFKEPVVTIMDHGMTIRFSDQGPGIPKKSLAQQPGFSSANDEMKNYIRGVGSGFPIVKNYLEIQDGRLLIEDNIRKGTVITIVMKNASLNQVPFIPMEQQHPLPKLSEREKSILLLYLTFKEIGPTDVNEHIRDISISTAHRTLQHLDELGLLRKNESKKHSLTKQGMILLKQLS